MEDLAINLGVSRTAVSKSMAGPKVQYMLLTTHEAESPTMDPPKGVPMASGQAELTNYVSGPLV